MRNKKPLSVTAAQKMFEWEFNTYWIYKPTKNFTEAAKDIEGKRNLYFIVTNKLLLSESDRDAMLNYVSEGNQLFIAAWEFDRELIDTLHLDISGDSPSLFENNGTMDLMRRTQVSLADTVKHGSRRYGFFLYPMVEYFSKYDSSITTVHGLGDKGKPDFISMPYGDGRIFLHLHPEAFTNYFLLREKNHEYMEHVLSYMNSNRKSVYWDDYYRLGNYPASNFSSLSFLFKYPPLKWAFLIALFSMLLYVLTNFNRRQRVIPVLSPNTNSSLSFVDTIGRLYLQHKDHHNIVHKMVTYFMEKIRTRYYLNTAHVNSEFISSLSRKSSVQETEVKSLFQYINQLQEAAEISDEQLLELNNRMLPFFKT